MIKLAFLALYAKRRVRILEKGVGDKSSALRFLLRPGVTSSKQTSSWSKRASPPSPGTWMIFNEIGVLKIYFWGVNLFMHA